MNGTRQLQFTYLFFGIIVVTLSIYINSYYINNNQFPDAIMLLFVGIAFLMLAYLTPHLFPKDERSHAIVAKSMFVNYFVLISAIVILFFLSGPLGTIPLTSPQVLTILFCVVITSIPLVMIVYSKLI